MNKAIVKKFFPKEVKAYEEGNCPLCAKKVDIKEFKDQISKDEFKISGICQACQNNVFN